MNGQNTATARAPTYRVCMRPISRSRIKPWSILSSGWFRLFLRHMLACPAFFPSSEMVSEIGRSVSDHLADRRLTPPKPKHSSTPSARTIDWILPKLLVFNPGHPRHSVVLWIILHPGFNRHMLFQSLRPETVFGRIVRERRL